MFDNLECSRRQLRSRFQLLLNEYCEKLKTQFSDYTKLPNVLYSILNENIPISHEQFIDLVLQLFPQQSKEHVIQQIISALQKYKSDNLIHKERAFYILYRLTGEEMYRSRIDETENQDFFHCLNQFFDKENSKTLKCVLKLGEKLMATAPMKLALSSANGSDRHGPAKLEGSKVLNMAINLVNKDEKIPKPSIRAEMQLLEKQIIIFEAYNDLLGTFKEYSLQISEQNVEKFFSCATNLSPETAFSDSEDPFRFYKYVFIFCGIIGFHNDPETYVKQPRKIWQDLMKFSGGYGIRLRLENTGPSRSGFSSSSAVMVTLLSLLYKASGQQDKLNKIYDLALLAENRLGMRSGWNDTYALRPGIHDFKTLPTKGLPVPIETQLDVKNLDQHLVLIHTGLQRKATGRLNRRHEVYLSKDPKTYPFILESLMIHDEIVDALKKQDYPRLGKLCTEYMELRIGIDCDATNPYLRYFFKYLLDEGLIYGGLLAGAMGGGIAQVVVTPQVQQSNFTLLDKALLQLQQYTFPDGKRPFNNPLFGRIEFQVNYSGVVTWIE